MNIDPVLLRKYNVPVPRYTSYPTVPFWKEEIDEERWKQVFREEFLKNNLQNGTGLNVHLPFYESLCTHFIRNISSAFDLHLHRNKVGTKALFSKAI